MTKPRSVWKGPTQGEEIGAFALAANRLTNCCNNCAKENTPEDKLFKKKKVWGGVCSLSMGAKAVIRGY